MKHIEILQQLPMEKSCLKHVELNLKLQIMPTMNLQLLKLMQQLLSLG